MFYFVKYQLFFVYCLGIEKEYEQKVLPDGKISIDGFLCVFDVSAVPNRPVEKQVDTVCNMLNNIVKTKKPVVLVSRFIRAIKSL